jgi:hypothetical protein
LIDCSIVAAFVRIFFVDEVVVAELDFLVVAIIVLSDPHWMNP